MVIGIVFGGAVGVGVAVGRGVGVAVAPPAVSMLVGRPPASVGPGVLVAVKGGAGGGVGDTWIPGPPSAWAAKMIITTRATTAAAATDQHFPPTPPRRILSRALLI